MNPENISTVEATVIIQYSRQGYLYQSIENLSGVIRISQAISPGVIRITPAIFGGNHF
jgi:hypothetical protein